jgi:ABC-type transport system involved in cytochrome c biogenesis permease subunit
MAIKFTMQGYLIYATMVAMLGAGLLMPWKRTRILGWAAYTAGAILAMASFAWRWSVVGHVPMKNVFEALLLAGALVYPITLVARRIRAHLEAADPWLALVFLVPAGFVLSDTPAQLPPILNTPLFVPHVLCYMLAYALVAKAAFQSIRQFASSEPSFERAAYRLVRLAFPLLTAGLVLGCWWGHLAWTRHWNWDPKELLSLASWLMVLVYLHVRALTIRRPRVGSIIILLALGLMVLTLLANFLPVFKGLHSYSI